MSYDQELTFAKELAYEAGQIMRRYFRAEDIGTEWKEDNTPVTAADTKINRLVIKRIQESFPDHGVLGEEENFKPERDLIWVVDPIDGTIPFSLGIPVSTFSLALVNRTDGQPVVAVVYDPFLDHLYTAIKGGGAYLNDERIKVSNAKSLDRGYLYVAGGFKAGKRLYDVGKCLNLLRDKGAKPTVIASFIYFGCKVATGSMAGAITGLASTWDLVTTALIVEEAGGIVTDVDGHRQRYDGEVKGNIVACTKEVHTELFKVINASRL